MDAIRRWRAERIMARRGHFYAVGADRSTPGWPYRSKRNATRVTAIRNRLSRHGRVRVYWHDR